MRREIQKGKFPVISFRSFVVCMSRFFGGVKISQKMSAPILHNSGRPFAFSSKMNALETAFVPSPNSSVPVVLGNAGYAQIALAIIEAISIAVVALLTPNGLHNLAVHINSFVILPWAFAASGVKCLRWLRTPSNPIPLIQPFKIFSIDNGVFALRKRNQTIRCIGWLRNRMPLQSVFWHVPTPIGICNAAILA